MGTASSCYSSDVRGNCDTKVYPLKAIQLTQVSTEDDSQEPVEPDTVFNSGLHFLEDESHDLLEITEELLYYQSLLGSFDKLVGWEVSAVVGVRCPFDQQLQTRC